MLNLDHDTTGYKLKVCSNTCGQVRLHTLFLWQPREDCSRQKRRRFLSSNFINQYFLCTCIAGVAFPGHVSLLQKASSDIVQILFRCMSHVGAWGHSTARHNFADFLLRSNKIGAIDWNCIQRSTKKNKTLPELTSIYFCVILTANVSYQC